MAWGSCLRYRTWGGSIGNLDFIWRYVDSCARGTLKLSECGPVWQLGVIATLIICGILLLILLRARASA